MSTEEKATVLSVGRRKVSVPHEAFPALHLRELWTLCLGHGVLVDLVVRLMTGLGDLKGLFQPK